MSEIIKQINVDGVDYDIVSESAENKISELNEKVENLSSGGGDSLWSYHKEGDKLVCSEPRITLGTGCYIGYNASYGVSNYANSTVIGASVWIAPDVFIGTDCDARSEYDVPTCVHIDKDVKIGSHVDIEGATSIKKNFFSYVDVSIGTTYTDPANNEKGIIIGSSVWIDSSSYIGPDTPTVSGNRQPQCCIQTPVFIGHDTVIGHGVQIGSNLQIEYDDSGMIFRDTDQNRTAYLPWNK